MNHDAIKHTVGSVIGSGWFVGAISLQHANEWAALVCAILGAASFACTINSWWHKRKIWLHKERHIEAEFQEAKKRHHDRIQKLHKEETSTT